MKNYFHGGIVMNGFLKHPYFAGTFRNGRNSSQAQKDFVGPGAGSCFTGKWLIENLRRISA